MAPSSAADGTAFSVFRNLFARMTAGCALDQFSDRRVQLPLPGTIRAEVERAITHIRWSKPAAYQSFTTKSDYSRLRTELEFY